MRFLHSWYALRAAHGSERMPINRTNAHFGALPGDVNQSNLAPWHRPLALKARCLVQAETDACQNVAPPFKGE